MDTRLNGEGGSRTQQGDSRRNTRPTEVFLILMLFGQGRGGTAEGVFSLQPLLHHPVGVGETEASGAAAAEREGLNKLILVTPPPSTAAPPRSLRITRNSRLDYLSLLAPFF